jgi:hypothetical protein
MRSKVRKLAGHAKSSKPSLRSQVFESQVFESRVGALAALK